MSMKVYQDCPYCRTEQRQKFREGRAEPGKNAQHVRMHRRRWEGKESRRQQKVWNEAKAVADQRALEDAEVARLMGQKPKGELYNQ